MASVELNSYTRNFNKAPKIIAYYMQKLPECITGPRTGLIVLAPVIPDVGKRYPPDKSLFSGYVS